MAYKTKRRLSLAYLRGELTIDAERPRPLTNTAKLLLISVLFVSLVGSSTAYDLKQSWSISGNTGLSWHTTYENNQSQTFRSNWTGLLQTIQIGAFTQTSTYIIDFWIRHGTNETQPNVTNATICYFGNVNTSTFTTFDAAGDGCNGIAINSTCRANITNATGCSITSGANYSIVMLNRQTANSTNQGGWYVPASVANFYASGAALYSPDGSADKNYGFSGGPTGSPGTDFDIALYGSATTATPSLTATNLSPSPSYHTNNATIIIGYNVSGDGLTYNSANCSLNIDNVTNTTTTNIALNATGLNWNVTTFGEGTHTWWVNCTSNHQANSTTGNVTLVVDRTNPIVNLAGNSVLQNNTAWNVHGSGWNLFANWTITDTYLYFWNVTVRNASGGLLQTNASSVGVTTTIENATNNYNLSGYFQGNKNQSLSFNVTVEDDHTQRFINDYANIVDFANRQLRYTTDRGTNINITAVSASRTPTGLTTWKDTDRYRWQFNWTSGGAGNRTATIRLSCDRPINYRGALYPFPAFVCGGSWIDFNIVEGAAYSVTPNGASWDVSISSASNTWTFASLGGLNIVSYLYYVNISQEPPGVDDLAASATTANSTALSYTNPGPRDSYSNMSGTSTITLQNHYGLASDFSHDGRAIKILSLELTDVGTPTGAVSALIYNSAFDTILCQSDSISANLGARAWRNFTFASCDPGAAGTYYFALNWSTTSATDYPTSEYGAKTGKTIYNTDTAAAPYSWSAHTNDAQLNHKIYANNLTYTGFGSTLYNETGGVLYNGSSGNISVNVTGLAASTTYDFYVDTWYNDSATLHYNLTNTTGADLISVTTLFGGTASACVKNEVTQADLSSATVSVSFIGPTNTTANTTTGCVDLSNLTTGDYTVRHSASGWGLRDQLISYNTSIGANMTLYLLNDTVRSEGVVQVRDKQGGSVEGAQVALMRYYGSTNTYDTVQEALTTDELGRAHMSAQAYNAYYKWSVTVDDEVLYLSTSPESLTLETDGLWRKYFVVDVGNDFYLSWRTRTSLVTAVTYNSATDTLTYTWADATGHFDRGCIDAKWSDGVAWRTTANCGSGSSGSVNLLLPLVATKQYQYRAWVDSSGAYSPVTTDNGWMSEIPAVAAMDDDLKVAAVFLFAVVPSALFASVSAMAVIAWNVLALAVLAGLAGVQFLGIGATTVIGLSAVLIGVGIFLVRR